MEIHNLLPHYLKNLKSWKKPPTGKQVLEDYVGPFSELLTPLMDDFGKLGHEDLSTMFTSREWSKYRTEALSLDAEKEERRVRHHLQSVEALLGLRLSGEIVLFGAFTMMDGYARFNRGTHRVFLGVDESHGRGAYLDILVTHELAHVARESRPQVWEAMGLAPKMTHDEFVESQTPLEHLFSEGYSCAISEILIPGFEPWNYAYQTESGFIRVLQNAKAIDQIVHRALKENHPYYTLYDVSQYGKNVPPYAHYVWAWQWIKQLLILKNGDPRELLAAGSPGFLKHALEFELTRQKLEL